METEEAVADVITACKASISAPSTPTQSSRIHTAAARLRTAVANIGTDMPPVLVTQKTTLADAARLLVEDFAQLFPSLPVQQQSS